MNFEKSATKPSSVGPFGSGNAGNNWDDGSHSTVRQLVISHYENGIRFIQFEYDDDKANSTRMSEKHGTYLEFKDSKTEVIKLDYPGAVLVSIQGSHRSYWILPTCITSLTFKSNKKTYGPFGCKGNTHFSIQESGSKIVGFHGRSANWLGLSAIGAYLMPLNHQREKDHPSNAMVHTYGTEKDAWRHSIRKPEKDGKRSKGIHITVSDNQVEGNKGNGNGNFTIRIRNSIKYFY